MGTPRIVWYDTRLSEEPTERTDALKMGNDKRPPNYKGGHKAKGCAVAALAIAGGTLAVVTGVLYGAFEAVRMVF